jgi:hypothetical protein
MKSDPDGINDRPIDVVLKILCINSCDQTKLQLYGSCAVLYSERKRDFARMRQNASVQCDRGEYLKPLFRAQFSYAVGTAVGVTVHNADEGSCRTS